MFLWIINSKSKGLDNLQTLVLQTTWTALTLIAYKWKGVRVTYPWPLTPGPSQPKANTELEN